MSDYRQKFENYKNALGRLNEGVLKLDQSNDLLRDGLIQRFEFTFELAWKTLKAVFEDEGLIGLNSPKAVLREAFAAEIIKKDDLWLSMLNDRNSTSHIYSEQVALLICNNIVNKYISELNDILKEIEKRYID